MITREILEDLYLKQDLSSCEIAKLLNCSQGWISKKLRDFSIIKLGKIESLKNKGYDFFYQLYIVENKSKKKIGQLLNTPTSTIQNVLKELNIVKEEIINNPKGRKTIIIICHHCKKEAKKDKYKAERYEHNYCSRDCFQEWKKTNWKTGPENKKFTSILVKCNHCEKDFYVTNGDYKNSKNKQFACSLSCRLKRTKTIINCASCNKEIVMKKSTLKYAKNFFCSKICRFSEIAKEKIHGNKALMTREIKNCANCSKIIVKLKSQIDNENVFCNSKCLGEWFSKTKSGSNSHSWKGGRIDYYGDSWEKIKKQILKRDNNICQDCGKDKAKNGKNMDVHHILSFRLCKNEDGTQNYTIPHFQRNLMNYCVSCHKRIEEQLNKFLRFLTLDQKQYISRAKFFEDFYNSPNSLPQHIQEIIINHTPQNVKTAFISNLPSVTPQTPLPLI